MWIGGDNCAIPDAEVFPPRLTHAMKSKHLVDLTSHNQAIGICTSSIVTHLHLHDRCLEDMLLHMCGRQARHTYD